jgi:hypothetical protein
MKRNENIETIIIITIELIVALLAGIIMYYTTGRGGE